MKSWKVSTQVSLYPSQFGGLEAMLTGLCDEYPALLRRNREIFVGCVIIFIYICALPTTTYVSWCYN